MDIETYKKVGEMIRITRMASQVEDMACLHIERLLADCMEIADIPVNKPYDFGELVDYEKNNLEKIELYRTDDNKVMMTFHDKEKNTREMSITYTGILENTLQIFNYITNQIMENLSPEIKKAMDEAQQ